FFFFFQAEDGILDFHVTGVQTCALPICSRRSSRSSVVTSALKRRSPSTVSSRRYELVLLLTTPGDVGSAEESAKQHEPERIEGRSEERRVGKECRQRRLTYHDKNRNSPV